MGRRGRAGALAITLGLAACADPAPTDPLPEPGAVVVMPVEGARLCAGTMQWWPLEAERVSERIGLPPRFELPVILGAAAVQDRCTDVDDPETVLGCTTGEGAAVAVYTTPEAFSHELVHGLRRHWELRSSAFFEEGFAESNNGSAAYPRALEIDPAQVPDTGQPEVLAGQSPAEFRSAQSYRVATHFVDTVARIHGEETVAAFMRGGIDDPPSQAIERFGSHFGVSLSDQAQAWRDAGTTSVHRGDPCGGTVEPAPTAATTLEATVDCDAIDTLGLIGGGEQAWVRRCISLDARAYQVQASGGDLRFSAVLGTCEEGSAVLDMADKLVEDGDAGTLEFAACQWAVTFSIDVDEVRTVTLDLDPG